MFHRAAARRSWVLRRRSSQRGRPNFRVFQYEWTDADRRQQQLTNGSSLRYFAPPPPRFKVGDAILCKTGPAADVGAGQHRQDRLGGVGAGAGEGLRGRVPDTLANSDDLVYAPNDTDEYVRPYVDSPPAKRRKLDAVIE